LTLKNLGVINKVVVSSEDAEILDITMRHQGTVAHRRDDSCATDEATDHDVITDYLRSFFSAAPSQHILKPDLEPTPIMIVYLRPTTPFRAASSVEIAIQTLKATPGATGLRSVHEMSESAYKCFEVLPGNILSPATNDFFEMVDKCNLPNQEYPKTFTANGVVDIVYSEQILNGATFGDSVIAYETFPTIEIDTPFDLEMAEIYYQLKWGQPCEVFKAKP
jgi:N-acylneuraminate cytidylyltransferase